MIRRLLPALLLLAACSKVIEPASSPESAPAAVTPAQRDGTPAMAMPAPAAATLSATASAADTNGVHWVTNPTSGARLAVYLQTPTGTGPWPAIVVVPGSNNPASRAIPESERTLWFETGFALITFDADGRGSSEGTEDMNGTVAQDGLAAILQAAKGLPGVDPDRIGVVSLSYGIAMSSNALTRYQTPARFLIDWEGPANRVNMGVCEDHAGQARQARPGMSFSTCDDETFWSQREGSAVIGRLRVPYQRVQCTPDHGHRDDFKNSRDMVNAALAGGVPLVRLNDNKILANVSSDAQISPWPADDRNQVLVKYAKELMEQTTGKAVTAGQAPAATQRQGPPGRGPRPGGARTGGGPGGQRPRRQ